MNYKMISIIVVLILPVYAGNLKDILQADTEHWQSYSKILQNSKCVLRKDQLLSPGTPLTMLTCSGATSRLYNVVLRLAHDATGPLLVDDLSLAPTNHTGWMRTFNKRKVTGRNPHGYVFTIEDFHPETLEKCIEGIRLFDYVWNPRAKFTAIFFKYVRRSVRDAVVRIFSNHDVVNPVILCPGADTEVIYRKSPYVPQSYPWHKFSVMKYCSSGHHFDASEDLNGLKFRVVLEDYRPQSFMSNGKGRGYDLMVLEVILQHLNGSQPSTNQNNIGTRLDNGSVVGAIGDVVEGRADLLGTHVFPTAAFWDLFTYTRYVAQDDLLIVIRKAPLAPLSTVLFFAFDSVTWLLLLSAVILSVIFFFAMRRDIGVGLQAIRIFLTGSASPAFMKQSHISQKTLFSFLAFFSLVVLNTFQGSIVSLLASPRYLSDLNTLDEVSKMTSLIFAPVLQMETLLTQDDDQDLIRRLLPKCEDTQSFDQFLKAFFRIVKGEAMASVMSDGGSRVFLHIPGLSHNGRPLLHIVSEPLMSPAFRMVSLTRTSPLLGAFNRLVPRLIQSGIYNHWMDQLFEELAYNGTLVHLTKKHVHKPMESLGTEYFQGGLYVLICGLIAGICVFLAEIFIPVFKKWNRNNYH